MRRMDSGNGVLTTRLGANGQKNEANGHVMDSEWTANGQCLDSHLGSISIHFWGFLLVFWHCLGP